jgi:predicted nucleotidyltransferase
MMDKESTTEFIIKTVAYYYPCVQGIYSFGSYQTDTEWPDSDVDIAVLLPYPDAKYERLMVVSKCRYRLEDILKKDVDLVNIRLASTVFQFQIVSTGRLIYTADERAVNEFEMLAISLYQKLCEERRGILEEFYETRRAYPV